MKIFLLLLPWLELWTLIELGSRIGALQVIAYCVLTVVLGGWLIRLQGEGMVAKVRQEFDGTTLLNPGLLADGLFMVFAGLLIMMPGLITDTLGVMLMIGPLRRLLMKRSQPLDMKTSVTLEGEFHRVDGEYHRVEREVRHRDD